MLFAGRGTISDALSIIVANALILLAYSISWAGIRLFDGRRTNVLLVLAPAAVWVGSCFVPGVMETLSTRTTIGSSLIMLIAAASATELWRGLKEPLPSRRPLLLLFVVLAAVFLARTAYGSLFPYPVGGSQPSGNVWYALFAFFVFVSISVLAFLFVALTKERIELSQRHNATVDPVTGALQRGAFMLQASRMVTRHGNDHRPICLILIDLEAAVGQLDDDALHRFAEQTLSFLKPADLIARLGRREFACVLSDISQGDATLVSESLQGMTAVDPVLASRFVIHVGVASSTQVGHDMRALMEAADAALEQARTMGEGVVLFHPSLERGSGDAGSGGRVIPFTERRNVWRR